MTVEIYRLYSIPTNWEWRWRVRAQNSKVLCSGEGYKRRHDMMRVVRRLFPKLPVIEVFPPS